MLLNNLAYSEGTLELGEFLELFSLPLELACIFKHHYRVSVQASHDGVLRHFHP